MNAREIIDRAVAAHRAGDLGTAIAGYRTALEAGGGAAVANQLAVALDQAGEPAEAESVLRTALAGGGPPDASLNLGRLLSRRGAAAEAVAPLLAAMDGGLVEARPLLFAAAAAARNDVAVVQAGDALLRADGMLAGHWPLYVGACFRAGRTATGIARARAAVALQPGAAAAAALAADAAATAGDPTACRALRRRAALLAPQQPVLHAALARVEDTPPAAARAFRRALCLDPGAAAQWSNYGALIKPLGDHPATRAALFRAATIEPRLVPPLRNLAVLLADTAEMEAAQQVYDRALALAPDDAGLAFKRALTFPTIPRDTAAIAAIRADVGTRVRALAAGGLTLVDPLAEVGLPNFYLAYHGLDDRALQSLIADTYLKLCPGLAWTAPHCRAPHSQAPLRPEGRRLRVGFASRFFHDHSIRYSTAGIVRNLDRSRFEVHVISDRPADRITLFRPGESADRHTVLPIDLAAARAAIAGLELDALVYGDIGMEPLTYYLAFARLAPVQAHLQGHPVTPGIPNLDYFLTSALQEPADCANHYRETPVPFAGTLFCYEQVPAVAPTTRAEFGLPAQGALYVCPQTLFKFHPDFDAILGAILAGDPDGWLVLLEDRLPARTRQLADRLADSLGDRCDRVLWVPRMPKQRYFQLIKLAAAVLDTTCFSGANTTLQALGLGVPVVTLPGDFVRGRMTLGWLREGDLMEMCATDAADYARIAVRLGRDPAWRGAVVDRIRAAAPGLFERSEVVDEIQDFLVRAVDAAAAGRPRINWGGCDG